MEVAEISAEDEGFNQQKWGVVWEKQCHKPPIGEW
jgi:hypothetical protein